MMKHHTISQSHSTSEMHNPRPGSGPVRSIIRPSEQVKKIQETSPE